MKTQPTTTRRWSDRHWLAGLWLAALVLSLVGLGDVALRDWDEGIVAQVAREIWRSQTGQPPNPLAWLYPTLNGVPYLNKPTLVHWLIAQCYAIGGVNEWMARLPGALLSATSVPLLYGIGRELFARRTPAIFAALTYLTWLPVVRHGRLAMLDGALVCFFLLMLYCLLRSRRDLRWGLGVGLSFGLMYLTKGAIGLLLGAIAAGFILWDTPRLLTAGYLWGGMLLGIAPVAAWYWAQWQRYGELFLGENLLNQSFSRLWNSVEGNQGPPWFYVLELLKYGVPWLIFIPQALHLTWTHRNWSWAKLVLVWSGLYFLVISLMQTKLPWYIMPLYPALALAVGALLAQYWHPGDFYGVKEGEPTVYPVAWRVIFGGLAIVGWVGCVVIGHWLPQLQPSLSLWLGAIALTFTVTTFLLVRKNSQFLLVLFWGTYTTLGMVLGSPYWLWELQESFAVKPVAALIQQAVPPQQAVAMSYPHSRPSLNFYSDRVVVSVQAFYQVRGAALTTPEAIARYWREVPNPYLLLEESELNAAALSHVRVLGRSEGFVLVRRSRSVTHPDLPSSTAMTQLAAIEN